MEGGGLGTLRVFSQLGQKEEEEVRVGFKQQSVPTDRVIVNRWNSITCIPVI